MISRTASRVTDDRRLRGRRVNDHAPIAACQVKWRRSQLESNEKHSAHKPSYPDGGGEKHKSRLGEGRANIKVRLPCETRSHVVAGLPGRALYEACQAVVCLGQLLWMANSLWEHGASKQP